MKGPFSCFKMFQCLFIKSKCMVALTSIEIVFRKLTKLFYFIRFNYERAFDWEYLTIFVRKAFNKVGFHRAWLLNWLLSLLNDWVLLVKRFTSKVWSLLLIWNQFWIVSCRIRCWDLICLLLADCKTIEILSWNKTSSNLIILGRHGNAHA